MATTAFLMPFGKHRHKPLHTIPKGYLRWLLDEAQLDRRLRLAVTKALAGQIVNAPSTDDKVDAYRDDSLARLRANGGSTLLYVEGGFDPTLVVLGGDHV